jgi:GxxExxY protein
MVEREPSEFQNRLSNEVIGAAIEVHRELKPGFREERYKLALAHELNLRKIRFEREKSYDIFYKGLSLGLERVDFIVENQLILEAKVVEKLLPVHEAQLIGYWKASGICLGLLINFNVVLLKDGIRRIVYTGYILVFASLPLCVFALNGKR